MGLIEKLISLENERTNVFIRSLYSMDMIDDLCHFARPIYDPNSSFFNRIFPEKWWQTKFNNLTTLDRTEREEVVKSLESHFDKFNKGYEKKVKETKEDTLKLREFLKASFEHCGDYSDQTKGYPKPPLEHPILEGSKVIDLPKPTKDVMRKSNLFDCIADRESRRKFTKKPLSLDELSFLLWSTQGVRKVMKDYKITLRTVPSGGARQPFETYLFINRVEGLEVGIYRYQPLEHKIVFLFNEKDLESKVTEGCLGQPFAGDCAVTFIWSTIPYRCEWRYVRESKKIIAQDSGHLCQNLYLAAESIECGTCAIGAYSQKKMDSLLKLDGVDEFVVYISPVGKIVE